MAATILPPKMETKIGSDGLYRLSAEQYDAMVEGGTLGPDDPVELIDGLLIQKMPQNGPHTTVIVKPSEWLVIRCAPRIPGSPRPIRLSGD